MNKVVIDASVAMKWTFPEINEQLTSEAVDLLQKYVFGALRIIVPDIFWAEVGNVLWKGVRRERWSRDAARIAATATRSRAFPTVSSSELLHDALEIAINHDRSVYDSLYLALAVQANCDLITADERLANAVAAYLPVKWLGAV
ncbi:MAG TPA: type II toxin-antitoxin system VapC family toxin [Terriglobales bacterium]|nr:type II toxin-antitoxin system VapC family toxin [Terriglobales bacterium]